MAVARDSGLDLELGERCSRRAWTWARRTFAARRGRPGEVVGGLHASFSNVVRLGDVRLALTSDGIGTKAELAERTGVYDTLGFDLVAMVADDLAANGVEPTNLTNVLDVDHLDEAVVEDLMRGLHAAAEAAGVAVVGGEIAELGGRVGGWGDGMHFNWCAAAVGVLPPGREPIDGRRVAAGDTIVALPSDGLRSNGFSLARRVLEARHGERWHEAIGGDGRSWGELLLTPSRICCRGVAALLDAGLPVHALAHVTGGGVPGNLARVLGDGLGADLDDPLPPQPFVRELQALGEVDERTAYGMWNMGHGMLAVAPAAAAGEVVAALAEAGHAARPVGRVTSRPGVRIDGRGAAPARLEVHP